MLPRRARLSREGFDSLAKARRFSTRHFSLSVEENGPFSGVGVVVPKKVARFAVGRHLLKRRIYSILADFQNSSRALAVFVRPGSNALSFEELKQELLELLEQAGIR